MKYRVVVLDLDGTYLHSGKKVSERNLAAVMACYERGMRIVIATARPPRAVRWFVPESLLSIASFVYYNGAQVECKHTGTVFHESIPSHVTADIVEYSIERYPELDLTMEVRDEWYGLTERDYMATMNANANPVVRTLDELKRQDATKILLSGAFEGTPLLDQFRQQVNILYTDHNTLVQVMPLDASKEQAVMKLCEIYGCTMEEVIAFGDDHNDIGLFQACGHSVAMGNAVAELREMADEVTLSNDQDGVAVVLERIVNG